MLQKILVVLCVITIASGQILFKLASAKIPDNIYSMQQWLHFLFSPIFLSSLCLYGFATILWIYTLKKIPLHAAYPFMALAFVLVPVLSFFFLHEKISMTIWIGTVFIIIGLIITTY